MTRNASLPWLAIAVLMAAAIVPSPQATLWPDTVRDLGASLAIARGEAFPLAGPSINNGPHMGPVWLWLQAIPFLFFSSLAAASVYVAAVGALKFPLLFLIGRSLSGPRLGLCFAVAAAFPGIATYQWMVFFHPNWVEAGIAATLLAAILAIGRKSIGLYYVACALLGFSIQMHPTALFYYPALLFALHALGARGWRFAAHLAGSVLMIAVWFATVPFAAELQQQVGTHGAGARLGEALRSFEPMQILTVLETAYWDVPLAVGATYGSRAFVPAGIWLAAMGLAFAGFLAGGYSCLRESAPPWRRAFLLALAALAAGWAAATVVRSYTSFYLCYFLLPLTAIVLGMALDRAVGSRQAAIRYAGIGALAALLLMAFVAAIGAKRAGRGAYIESRLPWIADLKHPVDGVAKATLVTAEARDALARYLCANPEDATLHGEFAYTLAAAANLDLRVHCPARATSTRILGPSDGRLAITGLAASEAARLGKPALERFKGLAAFRVARAIHPPEGRPIEPQWYYFELLNDRRPLARVSLEFATQPGEALAVFRLKPFDSQWRNYSVMRDGKPAAAALSTHNSEVYASPGASRWRVEFETDAPQWVDVHVF